VSAYKNHALHLSRHGDASRAKARYEEAIQVYRQFLDEHPGSFRFMAGLAGAYGSLADLLENTGGLQGAASNYLDAKELMQQVVRLVPDASGYRLDLAVKSNNLAGIYLQFSDEERALEAINEVMAVHGQNAAMFPETTRFQLDVIESRINRSMIQRQFGRTSEARSDAEEAVAELSELAA
jgi:tetratricopeptide (TPR) repeat protein